VNKSTFKCTSCSACCKTVGSAIDNAKKLQTKSVISEMLLSFPHDLNDEGHCSKLDETGNCSVYDDRPDICNVEKMYEIHYSKYYPSKEAFYEAEHKACNVLMEAQGIGEEFKIKN